MRVITGTARGRVLETVPGEDTVRPTTDRVKEAIFSAIQFEIEGREILDLFAGSGQLGIEALSRGARFATFIDLSKVSSDVQKRNLKKTGFTECSTVLTTDAFAFLKTVVKKFDIAFLDPPYSKGILQKVLPELAPKMNDGGIIICEKPVNEDMPQQVADFSEYKAYKYGKIAVVIYRKGNL